MSARIVAVALATAAAAAAAGCAGLAHNLVRRPSSSPPATTPASPAAARPGSPPGNDARARLDAQVEAFTKRPVPRTEAEMDALLAARVDCSDLANAGTLDERPRLLEDCHARVDPWLFDTWQKATRNVLLAGEGLAAHWGARQLVSFQSEEHWSGPMDPPVDLLRETGAMRAKTAPDGTDSGCVASNRPFGKGAAPAVYHFGAGERIYVRCKLTARLGAIIDPLERPGLEARASLRGGKSAGRERVVPLDLRALANQDHIDFDFAVADLVERGDAVGSVILASRLYYVTGYQDEWDGERVQRKPTWGENVQSITVSWAR